MKVSSRTKSILLGGAATFALGAVMPAMAQDDGDSDDRRRLTTVTVTATQRAESIQDVPIAVTALDPEALERAGVADITRLDQVAPSFNMNSSDTESGGTTLRIRGVGTTGNNVGLESSVGVFLDGVYLSRPGIALTDLVDVEQIEVLRGPQGTLFGRNTSAGALNIKSKAPDLNEYSGFGNVTLGDYNLVNVQGGANMPLVEDVLGIRVSGTVRQRNGFVEGANGSESGTRDRVTLRGQLLWDADEAGTFRLIADYARGEDDCCDAVWFNNEGAAPLGLFTANGFDATGGAPNFGDSALDDYKSNSENFYNPSDQWGISLEYNNETPFGNLTYIAAYRDAISKSHRNTDYTSLDIFTVGASPEARALGGQNYDPENNPGAIETTTHELRLQNTAFDDRLDWLVGLYYSEEIIDTQGSLTLLEDYHAGVSAGTLFSPVNTLNFWANGVDATGEFATNKFTQDAESFSIFTHNVFSVTDKFDLTVGLRYVEETKDGAFLQIDGQFDSCLATLGNQATIGADIVTAVALNCFAFSAPTVQNLARMNSPFATDPTALGLLPQEFDETFEDEEVVYTIKGSYKLNPTTNIYGGFTHGYKAGGFNLDASAGIGGESPQFDSEIIDAWEFGLKSDFWDGRARANVAVFLQEMEDFQVLEFTGIQFQTFNVGKAESTGVEFEGQAQLTDNFGASLGVTYTDANYPDDCEPDVADGGNPNATNLCGNPLTNAPEWVAILGGVYEQPIMNGAWTLNASGSVRHETERRTSTQPTEVGTDIPLAGDFQEENTKVNLRVGITSDDDRWTVELWGNNVTDERTKNVTFNIPLRTNARGQFVQDPATYGVTLRTRF